jgi:hypothetical protein
LKTMTIIMVLRISRQLCKKILQYWILIFQVVYGSPRMNKKSRIRKYLPILMRRIRAQDYVILLLLTTTLPNRES